MNGTGALNGAVHRVAGRQGGQHAVTQWVEVGGNGNLILTAPLLPQMGCH